MALISLDHAKEYLRVDSADEDALIGILLSSAERLCIDVGRLSEEKWREINDDESEPVIYSALELSQIRELLKVAILYTLGYLYEHREEADHHDLVLTLRNLLFSIREGVF
ncbi:MAG: phage gp6-like head-tail connector protein [Oscillospiraceae bacterium]|nr:phage gp6-like head-tail connector protein [Oscillospiraceae bacterium]